MLANCLSIFTADYEKPWGVTPPNLTAIPQKPSMKFASFKNLGGTPNVLGNLWLENRCFRWIDFSIVSSGSTRVPGRPGPRCCDPSVGFCGKARVRWHGCGPSTTTGGLGKFGTSFFRLKRSHKILDFLVEHDPIFDELAYFEKLGWVKHHQLVFWSESHTDASYQLPVPLLQGDFFFCKDSSFTCWKFLDPGDCFKWSAENVSAKVGRFV